MSSARRTLEFDGRQPQRHDRHLVGWYPRSVPLHAERLGGRQRCLSKFFRRRGQLDCCVGRRDRNRPVRRLSELRHDPEWRLRVSSRCRRSQWCGCFSGGQIQTSTSAGSSRQPRRRRGGCRLQNNRHDRFGKRHETRTRRRDYWHHRVQPGRRTHPGWRCSSQWDEAARKARLPPRIGQAPSCERRPSGPRRRPARALDNRFQRRL